MNIDDLILVSVDDHVVEPPDLFEGHIPAKYKDDVPKLIAMDLTVPDLSVADSGPFVVSMPVARCVPPVVERLREVLCTHPGTTEVHLRLRGRERTTVVRLDDKLRVATSPALIGDLKQLLGPACVG